MAKHDVPTKMQLSNRASAKRWRLNNPEKYREYMRSWRIKNKVKKAAMDRAWYEANKDRKKEYDRAYGKANRVKINERNKRWRAANPDKVKVFKRRWVENHPIETRLYCHARRTKTQGVKIVKEEIENWDSRICRICNEFIDDAFDIDHKIPLSRGGEHEVSNLQLTHRFCNRSKGAKMELAYV